MKKKYLDQITTYNSMSEFLLTLGKLEMQDNDFSISSLDGYLSDEPIKSTPFRTNFFNFLMIVDGEGVHFPKFRPVKSRILDRAQRGY